MTARLLTRTRHCITGRIPAASIRTAAAFCSSRAQSSLSPHGSACSPGLGGAPSRAPTPTAATHPAVTPRSPAANAPRPLRRPHTGARVRAGRSPAPAEPALFPSIPVLGTAAAGRGERRAGGGCPARGCLAGPPWRRSSGRQRRETEGGQGERDGRAGPEGPLPPGRAVLQSRRGRFQPAVGPHPLVSANRRRQRPAPPRRRAGLRLTPRPGRPLLCRVDRVGRRVPSWRPLSARSRGLALLVTPWVTPHGFPVVPTALKMLWTMAVLAGASRWGKLGLASGSSLRSLPQWQWYDHKSTARLVVSWASQALEMEVNLLLGELVTTYFSWVSWSAWVSWPAFAASFHTGKGLVTAACCALLSSEQSCASSEREGCGLYQRYVCYFLMSMKVLIT